VTPQPSSPALDEEGLYQFLMTPLAVRECAEAIYAVALSGESAYFTVDEGKLADVAERVAAVTRAAYPDVRRVPFHGRLRHFDAGGVHRVARFEELLAARGADDAERLRARFELVITSVLLDAGAGPTWSYVEPKAALASSAAGGVYSRSEGLAVASYDWFLNGGLASDGKSLRADADGLQAVDDAALRRAFQVTTENPLVGTEGRAALMRALGAAVRGAPSFFGDTGRLGELGVTLKRMAEGGAIPAVKLFAAVQSALGPIWPSRATLAGKNLGDVWIHSTFGYVPFHKLVQWLSYSLCEPLAVSGVRVTDLDELTGLAEYRNGGLFIDSGVLLPKEHEALELTHAVSADLVIEWRALTIALLDRTVANLRSLLGVTAEELPLASALEGGTWSAGRQIASELREGGGPPLRIESDGTVF
jgi:hypothetical protein